ncbi:MAG: hypothetical protein GY839_02965 [candidate division Zixibacteria bacterium]|nr:hypothetical protein [candidate division Zixibacteria bacterium]
MSKSNINKMMSIAFVISLVILTSPKIYAQHKLSDTFQYISPRPGARYVSRATNLILKPGGILDIDYKSLMTLASIRGSISGNHGYRPVISDDNKSIVLILEKPFEPGEEVTVCLDESIRTINNGFTETGSFSFTISRNLSSPFVRLEQNEDQAKNTRYPKHDVKLRQENDVLTDNGVSLPSDFPYLSVLIDENPDSGYIFLTSKNNSGPETTGKYLIILNNNNDPIFYNRFDSQPLDFKLHHNGLLTYNYGLQKKFYVMDSTYRIIDSYQCGNGYATNPHDFQMFDNGHVLMLARDPQVVDMSEIVEGGNPNAVVTGQIIQELDILHNVVWQWRSWDHFVITDATWDIDLLAHLIDYVHANALEIDYDGNILLSSRHLDEITKIDHQTGNIIWRLGGENNQFTFVDDTLQFSHQHDIRRLPNGNITLFDNANLRTPNYSRAIEYQLDEDSLIAYKVWEFYQTPNVAAAVGGNVQRLSGGNTIIGWGSGYPNITEVNDVGQKIFELAFDYENLCYRAFRFHWKGMSAVPYLVVEAGDSHLRLLYNKFGDSTVAKYYIYADTMPNPTTIIDSTLNTFVDLYDLINSSTYYFRVTAVDSQSHESPFSNEVSARMPAAEGRNYLPGDANMANGAWPPSVIGSDVTYLVNYFRHQNTGCQIHGSFASADVNGDCLTIGSDVTKLVGYFRGMSELDYCPDYEPAWPTPRDLPVEAPADWPNCEILTGGRVVPDDDSLEAGL